jgi:hypothetical protein
VTASSFGQLGIAAGHLCRRRRKTDPVATFEN